MYEEAWHVLRKRHLAEYMTAYRVEAFMNGFAGERTKDFEDWLPDYIKPPKAQLQGKYSPDVVASVEMLFKKNLLSQLALTMLDAAELRKSGAWANKNG